MTTKAEAKIEHKNINDAILAIHREVGYVQKTGRNQAQNYKYAGEADLIAALRPIMVEHGVTVSCVDIQYTAEPTITATQSGEGFSKNTVTRHVHGLYTFEFSHTSGTSRKVVAVGEGVDNGDKASYKAATGALKYVLRQTFLIETGDEPEAHEVESVVAFKNAALRNKFFENVVETFAKAHTDAELDAAVSVQKAKFAEMDGGSEHDQLAVGELRKRYVLRKQQIARERELDRQADDGNFEEPAEFDEIPEHMK